MDPPFSVFNMQMDRIDEASIQIKIHQDKSHKDRVRKTKLNNKLRESLGVSGNKLKALKSVNGDSASGKFLETKIGQYDGKTRTMTVRNVQG